MVYTLGGVSLVLFVLLVVSVRLLWRLGQVVLELEDQVEESLDILDDCHRVIDEVTQTPINFDDPLVRRVLVQIRGARDAMLLIANKIIMFNKGKETHGKKGTEKEAS